MVGHPQFTGEYHLQGGTSWPWSVTYFDEEDDGGLTGYQAEVHFQSGPVQMHAATMVTTGDATADSIDLAAPQVFKAEGYPGRFELALPAVVGEGLAAAITRVYALVGA
jgi:hypothetical protein